MNESMSAEGKRSFELFRTELKNVEVITYDELFEKIRLLLSLLENDSVTSG